MTIDNSKRDISIITDGPNKTDLINVLSGADQLEALAHKLGFRFDENICEWDDQSKRRLIGLLPVRNYRLYGHLGFQIDNYNFFYKLDEKPEFIILVFINKIHGRQISFVYEFKSKQGYEIKDAPLLFSWV